MLVHHLVVVAPHKQCLVVKVVVVFGKLTAFLL